MDVYKLQKEIHNFKQAILNKQCHITDYKRNDCIKRQREYFVDTKCLPELFSKDKLIASCLSNGKRFPRPSFDNIVIEELGLE